jgi:hypothetical protein
MMLILAVVGAGGFCFVMLGCGGGLYWMFGRGPGGGLLGKAPPVTRANYDKMELCMTRAEIETIMEGPGAKSSADDVVAVLARRPVMRGDPPPQAPLGNAPGAAYVIYRDGNKFILVGYLPSQKYGELSPYQGWLEDQGGGNIVIGARATSANGIDATRADLLKKRDEKEAQQKYLDDPKWKKGPETRKLLLGLWSLDKRQTMEYKADGAALYRLDGRQFPGTYIFQDDTHIKISGASSFAGPDREYKMLVCDTDLGLFQKQFDGTYADQCEKWQRKK